MTVSAGRHRRPVARGRRRRAHRRREERRPGDRRHRRGPERHRRRRRPVRTASSPFPRGNRPAAGVEPERDVAGQTVPNLVVARVQQRQGVALQQPRRGPPDRRRPGLVRRPDAAGSSYIPAGPARAAWTPALAPAAVAARSARAGPSNSRSPASTGCPSAVHGAVALNVTVTDHSGPESFLTVYPAGGARPLASNLNFSRGPDGANLVVARVGADGKSPSTTTSGRPRGRRRPGLVPISPRAPFRAELAGMG